MPIRLCWKLSSSIDREEKLIMHCFKCGKTLPPEAATCPSCGAATPYNVTASTPGAFNARPDSAVPDNTGEEQAPPVVSQGGETPQVERTVLQQPPQPDKAQSTPAQQQGSPQPAPPSSSPTWQPPSLMPGQPGAAQPQQGQSWPQQGPWPSQQGPAQPFPWPQQGQQPIGPQSYPAWQQPQQPWPQPFPGQQPPQQGPWQPQPGVPQPFPGQQGQQLVAPQSYPAWQQPGAVQPQQGQPWPQPFPGQSQFQSSPAWQQPQMGMAQPVPAQLVSQATPAPAAQALPSQQMPQRRGLSLEMILLLVIIALVVIGGSGLLYYTTVAHPANLHAQATSVAQDFLTAQTQSMSPQSIYNRTTRGKPAINDPLSSANGSIWSESSQGNGRCLFTNGAFHTHLSGKGSFIVCFANSTRLSDFAFQVQMTIASGLRGGLLFRTGNTQANSYAFDATSDGFYALTVINGTNGIALSSGPSPAIKTGLNQSNLLTVIARGNDIYLYINKQYIAKVNDSTFSSGKIGLYALSGDNPQADIAFSNAQVWKL